MQCLVLGGCPIAHAEGACHHLEWPFGVRYRHKQAKMQAKNLWCCARMRAESCCVTCAFLSYESPPCGALAHAWGGGVPLHPLGVVPGQPRFDPPGFMLCQASRVPTRRHLHDQLHLGVQNASKCMQVLARLPADASMRTVHAPSLCTLALYKPSAQLLGLIA